MSNETDEGEREALVEHLAEAIHKATTCIGEACIAEDFFDVDLRTARAVLPLVASQVEAAVYVVRAERDAEVERLWSKVHAEQAMVAMRHRETLALREAIKGLPRRRDGRGPYYVIYSDVRALLAPSPAEGKGEAIHDDGCAEWCNHCEVCGTGTPYGSRCPNHPNAPAPVSSGEAGDGPNAFAVQFGSGIPAPIRCDQCGGLPGECVNQDTGEQWGSCYAPHPAPAVTPNAEDGAS